MEKRKIYECSLGDVEDPDLYAEIAFSQFLDNHPDIKEWFESKTDGTYHMVYHELEYGGHCYRYYIEVSDFDWAHYVMLFNNIENDYEAV